MNKNKAVDRLCRIRDELDFRLRFAEETKTPIVTIDTEDAYLFLTLIEMQIKKMKRE